MYAVVSDVEKYPEFLPWVTDLRILRRVGENVFDCEMHVGFAGLKESYVSRVAVDPVRRSVDVAQTEGPFRTLENHWRFVPRGGICEVDFAIDFEFRSPLLNMVAGKAFERVLVRMTDAFEARARTLSGQPA
jgi:coenzyme Q-binding protein COQ10